jgi:hypothetical protein
MKGYSLKGIKGSGASFKGFKVKTKKIDYKKQTGAVSKALHAAKNLNIAGKIKKAPGF